MRTRLRTLTKRLRTAAGLTQRALAGRAGMSNPYIAQRETGHRGNPTVLVAARLSVALGVPVMELIECVMKEEAQPASSERRAKR